MSVITFGAVQGWINKEDDDIDLDTEFGFDSSIMYEHIEDTENKKGTFCTGCCEECDNDDAYCPF